MNRGKIKECQKKGIRKKKEAKDQKRQRAKERTRRGREKDSTDKATEGKEQIHRIE